MIPRRRAWPLLVALLNGAPAAAQLPPICFTRVELRAASAVAAGPLLAGVADKCAIEYPQVSTRMMAARRGLARRFDREAREAAPIISEKLARLLGLGLTGADAQATLTAAQALLPALFQSAVAPKIDETRCRQADAIAGAVLPLKDAQVVDVLAAFVEIEAADPRQRAFRLCEDDRQ